MTAVFSSLLRALAQLADARVLRVLGKSLAVSLVLCALLGWGGWWLIDRGLTAAGLGDALLPDGGALRGIAALLLTLGGLWLLWRVVALAVIQFFADEVVQAVEARHYPAAAARARDLSVPEQLRASLGSAMRALLVNLAALPFAVALLVTGVGTPLLFLAVNAVLLGRELQDMVWLRHRHAAGEAAPVSRAERYALGGVVAAMLAVPFLNLLAPIVGAAAATHLIHRRS
ncbi:MAG: EI24 domain-containing protein [Croceibacterium sp.]